MAQILIPGSGAFQEPTKGAQYLVPGGGAVNVAAIPNNSYYYVDEAQLREPNLWIPGKKPVGAVKVDWSNPLTRGLIDFCVLNRVGSVTHSNLAEYKSNRVYTTLGTNIWTGGDLLFDASSGGVDFGKSSPRIIENGYTLTFHGLVSSTPEDGQLICCDSTSGTWDRVFQFRCDQSGNKVRFIRFDASNNVLDSFASATTITLGRFYIISAVFIKGTGSYIYINGVQDGSSTTYKDTANKNISTTGTGDLRIGAFKDGSGPNYILRGKCKSAMVHDSGLSAAEISALHSNLYQFLIPA